MQRQWLWAALVSAGVLTACGGSGGDDTSTDTNTVNAAVSGVAAKGLMAHAIVTAHAVKADGTVDSAVLASTETDGNGKYTLTFSGTKGQPYVIKVSAKADGSTTHLDEVNGLQPLSAGFTMRSLFVPTSSGNVSTSISVTPFSEMAVGAAEKASGGLTSANVAQARSNVAQLLGFDPSTVTAIAANDAAAIANATPEQKALLVMLTAVSQMASTNALGCDTGTAGQKTQCVVEKLGKATSTDSLKLNRDGTDVSAVLAAAANTVLSDDKLNAGLPPVALANVLAKLECTGDACAPAKAGTPVASDTTGPAIAAAKSLFDNLRSDWLQLFGKGSATNAASAFETQGSAFENAMKGVQAPVEMTAKDLGVLLMGIDLYNDVKAGRTNVFTRGRATGAFTTDTFVSTGFNAVGCTLYQDEKTTTTATSADNAKFIGCRASYYTGPSVNPATKMMALLDWAHGFTLTPSAEAGTFSYASRARYRSVVPTAKGFDLIGSGVRLSDTNEYNGTITTNFTTDTANLPLHVIGFTAKGELPGAFATGGTTLVNDSHTWNLSGTRSIAGANDSIASLSGTVEAFKDGSQQSKLEIKSASLTEIPVSHDALGNIVAPGSTAAMGSAGGEIGTGAFNVVWSTPGAEFEGAVTASASAWDKSQTVHAPTQLEIAGALRTIDGSTKTEFFSGKLMLSATGLAQFDATQDTSDSNNLTVSASLQGKATAPGRPQLEMGVATSMRSDLKEPSLVTVSYRSLVNGTPKNSVTASVSRNAAGKGVVSLNEAASNLSMTVVEGANSADLLLGGSTVIGRVDRKGVLTFVDGSFVTLDVGQ